MKYTVGNSVLHVEVQGEGQSALVFLHYWGGTHRTWQGVAALLADSFRCVTYDSRGWGESKAGSDDFSISELADDAQALVRQRGLEKYVLIGHSMGGKVAQLLASRRPEGLTGLVLVAPASPAPTHFPEEAFQQQLHAYDNRDTVLQTINFLTSSPPSPELVEQIVSDSLSGSPAAVMAWPTTGLREDISAEVPKIDVPTLILAGEHDNLDSIEQHRREVLSRISRASLEVVSGSGHLIPIEAPQQLATAIKHFVSQLN
ncbi:alpha/beta fold hydrolase [Terriglobus roseus]|uniref:Pimeloyl-ACP methyl ester carboxylesterase n=1 Tax=Terriglobus roseus TaxID=392734 RepID=A0A1H4JA56_9BACT|nr:alpha/beta hydrolase [Terriglobus roseus]SEB43111.1 Pimeloyl-ACP methyl ester carboxylesterase [Terriglobus roseus]